MLLNRGDPENQYHSIPSKTARHCRWSSGVVMSQGTRWRERGIHGMQAKTTGLQRTSPSAQAVPKNQEERECVYERSTPLLCVCFVVKREREETHIVIPVYTCIYIIPAWSIYIYITVHTVLCHVRSCLPDLKRKQAQPAQTLRYTSQWWEM